MVVGRLAPTPSGHLHLGNATAFLACWNSVRDQGGELLLRIEDADTTRSRPDVEASQRADLKWLGLAWDRETPRQSERDYQPFADRLAEHTYQCTCTRKLLRAEGGVYPGTCRDAGHTEGVLRFRLPPGERLIRDRVHGARMLDPNTLGDPILRRRDGVWAYNLCVVADDITDGVTEVVRGSDLLDMSAVQEVLWQALGGTPPSWQHSPLVLGTDGRKLSKSHGSLHLAAMAEAGWTAAQIRAVIEEWLSEPSRTVRVRLVEGAVPEPGKLEWEWV